MGYSGFKISRILKLVLNHRAELTKDKRFHRDQQDQCPRWQGLLRHGCPPLRQASAVLGLEIEFRVIRYQNYPGWTRAQELVTLTL